MRCLSLAALIAVFLAVPAFGAQEQRAKARISKAGFTITALPLLAAKDWAVSTLRQGNHTELPRQWKAHGQTNL